MPKLREWISEHMNRISALLPAALLVIVATSHVHALLSPPSELLGVHDYVMYGLVFATPFVTSNAMNQSGHDTNVLSLYAAHKHLPVRLTWLAYLLLAGSLLLLAAAWQADMDSRRRATAFWLCLLSCPSVVWWHFKSAPVGIGKTDGDV